MSLYHLPALISIAHRNLCNHFSRRSKAFKRTPTLVQCVHSSGGGLLIKADGRLCLPSRFKDWKTDKQAGGRWTDGLQPATVQAEVTFTKCLRSGTEGTKRLLSPTMYHPRPISFQRLQHSLEFNHWAMTRRIQRKFFPSERRDTDPDKEKEKVGWRKRERERWGETECKGHLEAPQRKRRKNERGSQWRTDWLTGQTDRESSRGGGGYWPSAQEQHHDHNEQHGRSSGGYAKDHCRVVLREVFWKEKHRHGSETPRSLNKSRWSVLRVGPHPYLRSQTAPPCWSLQGCHRCWGPAPWTGRLCPGPGLWSVQSSSPVWARCRSSHPGYHPGGKRSDGSHGLSFSIYVSGMTPNINGGMCSLLQHGLYN